MFAVASEYVVSAQGPLDFMLSLHTLGIKILETCLTNGMCLLALFVDRAVVTC